MTFLPFTAVAYIILVCSCVVPLAQCQPKLDAAQKATIHVLVNFSAFPDCSQSMSSTSSGYDSSSSSSSTPRPLSEPQVYLKHGNPSSNAPWTFQKLKPQFWAADVVVGVIPRDDEFVVLCVGTYIHCDASVNTSTTSDDAGGCVEGSSGFVNFRPSRSSNRSALLVVPSPTNSAASSGSGDAFGVIAPYCEITEPLLDTVGPSPPSSFFVLNGTSAHLSGGEVSASASTTQPCRGNGRCHVIETISYVPVGKNTTPHEVNVVTFEAVCSCNGYWSGSACESCSCPPPPSNGIYTTINNRNASSYCELISGQCIKETELSSPTRATVTDMHFAPTSAPSAPLLVEHSYAMSMNDNATRASHGVVIVLFAAEWFNEILTYNTSYIRFNNANLTTDPSQWRNWGMEHVPPPTDVRWGAASSPGSGLNISKYVDERASDGISPRWLAGIIPGGMVQFVVYSESLQDFIHCSETTQRVGGGGGDHVVGAVQCVGDSLNGQNNFFALSGVVEVTPVSFKMRFALPSGCQWGNNNTSPSELALCSGNGLCSIDTYFSCVCKGNFTGVSCGECDCFEGATCAPEDGTCVCQPSFAACNTSARNVCVDIKNDVQNCGACGNDCTRGISSAIAFAACTEGVCDVRMISPMDWVVCFRGSDMDSTDNMQIPESCFRGFDFVVVLSVSFPLFAASIAVLFRFRQQCPHSHQHRQTLFLLLSIIAGLRLIYAVIAIAFLETSRTPDDAVRSRAFFAATMITLNAYADLFTGFIDLLLTAYWLFVLDKVQEFPKRILTMGYLGMTATLTVATIVDYSSRVSSFDYTFFTIAILLFFTALMHMTVIVEVLLKFVVWWRVYGGAKGGNRGQVQAAAPSPPSPFVSPGRAALFWTNGGTQSNVSPSHPSASTPLIGVGPSTADSPRNQKVSISMRSYHALHDNHDHDATDSSAVCQPQADNASREPQTACVSSRSIDVVEGEDEGGEDDRRGTVVSTSPSKVDRSSDAPKRWRSFGGTTPSPRGLHDGTVQQQGVTLLPPHDAEGSSALKSPKSVNKSNTGGSPDGLLALAPPSHPAAHAVTSTSVQSHFIRVTLIALVCLVCWMVRSVMLLGRATKNPLFYTGLLSFSNPSFTLVYLTVLTLLPVMLIAAIFIVVSFDVLRETADMVRAQ